MEKYNLDSFSTSDLLHCYADILKELKKRRIVRTQNNPVADYAEWLVSSKLQLSLFPNSKSGYDARSIENERIQIKSRRLTSSNPSRQLGVIRNLEKEEFDYLIAVIFNEDFSVKEVYKIPHRIIDKYAKYSKHQNGYILQLRGELLKDVNIENITNSLVEKK